MRTLSWPRAPGTALALLLAASMLVGCAVPGPRPGQDEWRPAAPPVAAAEPPTAGSLYVGTRSLSMFTDLRARQVGDVLTVRLVERTDARKRADTQIQKDAEVVGPAPTLIGEELQLDTSASVERQLQALAQSRQSNELSGSIAVTVQAVYPNGNLYVSGEKWVALNTGDEYIRLAGIVRAVDVGTDNSVLSTQVADARIQYSGRGAMADSNRPGLLARFFVNPIWPF
ncbi:MAG: flagellar basal body L-ring protein FlgH [Pseudomonadales bacterium]|nr:flagellar basal body L-ring protein FlgH [Pseudomonadales bacterium]